jgi:alpha-beta hydrolase superfamily lysophospholipase
MISEVFSFTASDGKPIYTHLWSPENRKQVKGILQIIHGMQEHASRYVELAEYLVQKKYVICASDHRGHGKTAGSPKDLGLFTRKNGWVRVLDDLIHLNNYIKDKYPDKPLFLLGHSMGSFFAWHMGIMIGEQLNGVILSSTSAYPGVLTAIGLFIALLVKTIKGRDVNSNLLHKLSVGSYNSAFKPNRTDYDWLSRDEREVDRYIADPFCGGVSKSQFYYDLYSGIRFINKSKNIRKIRRDLPFYLISGTKDPLSRFTKGVLQLMKKFKKAGLTKISHKFYDNGRHELLKEINRLEVFEDISSWLDEQVVA